MDELSYWREFRAIFCFFIEKLPLRIFQLLLKLFSPATVGTKWTNWGVRIWFSEGNPPTREIIWSELYRDSVSWDKLDTIFLHLSADIRTYHHVREGFWKLDFENGSWEGFEHFALDFDFIVFRHADGKNWRSSTK